MSKKVLLSFLLAFAMSTLLGQALLAQPNAPLLDGTQMQPPVQAAVSPQGGQPTQNPLPGITPPNPSFFCQAACTPAPVWRVKPFLQDVDCAQNQPSFQDAWQP